MKMKDYYFKGIHYAIKNHLLSDPTVELYETDFKRMKDYILELEWKLYLASGEHTKSQPLARKRVCDDSLDCKGCECLLPNGNCGLV